MANITNIPGVLILDTAADNIVPAGADVRIRKLRWVGGTTAGHVAEITDAGGTVAKWRDIANAANYVVVEENPCSTLTLNGLRVLTLQSGVLYVYYGWRE